MVNLKAVILAGGFGTRMRPLTFTRPKPLLPLVNKPVLYHILDHLKMHGVTEVFLTTNYLRGQVVDSVGGEYNGVKINYPLEEQPLGTAGCVRNIREGLDETFLVIQGDTITDIDISSLVKSHRFYSGLCTIAGFFVEDPWNYGIMELDDAGRVRHFHEKPMVDDCKSNLANTGIYVLEPEALDFVPARTFFDFAKDLFPRLLERESIYGKEFSGFWVDVGQPGGFIRARDWMMKQIENRIHSTASVDGRLQGKVVVGEGTILEKGSLLIGPVVVGDNVVVKKDSIIGPYTTIMNDVTFGERSLINGGIIFEEVRLGSDTKLTNTFIAEKCSVGTNNTSSNHVVIGSGCNLGGNISISEGSRIWPNIRVLDNSMVSGTLRSFMPLQESHNDARWVLRTVSPDEAFYFNKSDGGYIQYTGFRARSLWDFIDILKQVDSNSMKYHFRGSINDFSQWVDRVLCDPTLSNNFESIKSDMFVKSRVDSDYKVVRKAMVDVSRARLNRLLEEIRPSGYV
ncbi:MAG: sugar phosphate nucleotidyltransferase [Candidatus Altiarchaeota archaeon]